MSDLLDRPEARLSGGWRADVAWVLGYFLLVGLVAGVVWWLVVSPAYYIRTSGNAVMLQGQLGVRVNADGWFVTIGLVAGALGGLALTRWRERDPLLTLLTGFVASIAGGVVALRLGEALGKRDVPALVKAAKVQGHVPDSLHVISSWVVIAWPVGFLLLSVLLLLGTRPRGSG